MNTVCRLSGTLLPVLLGFAWPGVAGARTDTVVGVLQEISEERHNGVRLATDLRVGFRSTAGGWAAVCASKPSPPWGDACHLPDPGSERTWTVFHRGKSQGQVVTAGWVSQKRYMDAGLLRVTSRDLPGAGPRSDAYGGWTGGVVHRPLAAILDSSRSYSTWLPVAPTASDRSRVFPMFQRSVPQFLACNESDPDVPVRRKTQPRHIEIFSVMRSPRGDRLIGVRLRRVDIGQCDGTGEFASDAWFLDSKEHPLTPLVHGMSAYGFTFTLAPVEIGDFDGDGRDEALFWFSGYNEEGFLLFHDGFKQVAKFTWGFH